MKKIAVLVPSFTIEYSQDFLDGIMDYFSDKDVKLIIAQTQIQHNDTGLYDYQFWTTVDWLAAKEIDGYIIPAGLYTVKRTIKQLQKNFIKFGSRPVICSAMDLNLANSYVVQVDCFKAINDIVTHLKNHHNCKKIAFMSANSTNSAEAFERFEAYKEALRKNGLDFNPDYVMDGFFCDFGAFDYIKDHFTSKEQITFDAVVCANDNMAIGTIKGLKELGLNVPKDVKVTGFDNAPVAYLAESKLSTIEQNIYSQGTTCAELAYKVLNGEKIEKVNTFHPMAMFRQSCGCIPVNNHESFYYNTEQETVLEPDKIAQLLDSYENNINEKMNITTILDMIRGSNTLRQYFYNLTFLAGQAQLDSLFINLFDSPVYISKDQVAHLPETVELAMYAENISGKNVFNPKTIFNTSERIFPPEEEVETAGSYIIHPIFAGEAVFGYLTGKLQTHRFPSYQVYLKMISSSISQSFEYTQKLIQAEELSTEVDHLSDLAKTDELTGLLNRRGFMELGQRTLDILQEMSNAGVIFFADMDGLKQINDTYGHKMGDKAIQVQAKVLKKVFRNSDIIGRISGDEFAVVASGMLLNRVPATRKKIDTLCKEFSEEFELPFTISISVGAVDLAFGSSLVSLLSNADKLLYEEKHLKHCRRFSEL